MNPHISFQRSHSTTNDAGSVLPAPTDYSLTLYDSSHLQNFRCFASFCLCCTDSSQKQAVCHLAVPHTHVELVVVMILVKGWWRWWKPYFNARGRPAASWTSDQGYINSSGFWYMDMCFCSPFLLFPLDLKQSAHHTLHTVLCSLCILIASRIPHRWSESITISIYSHVLHIYIHRAYHVHLQHAKL